MDRLVKCKLTFKYKKQFGSNSINSVKEGFKYYFTDKLKLIIFDMGYYPRKSLKKQNKLYMIIFCNYDSHYNIFVPMSIDKFTKINIQKEFMYKSYFIAICSFKQLENIINKLEIEKKHKCSFNFSIKNKPFKLIAFENINEDSPETILEINSCCI